MESLSGAIGSWYEPFETVSVLAPFFSVLASVSQGIRRKIDA
jgi:hypothetical protein